VNVTSLPVIDGFRLEVRIFVVGACWTVWLYAPLAALPLAAYVPSPG